MESLETSRATGAARVELESLRRRAAELEATLKRETAPGNIETRREAARQAINETWRQATQKASPAEASRRDSHPDAISLKLLPEVHDERMGSFIHVLQEKGVAKAIQAAEDSDNPHLIDDFHRVLVEWVHEGLPANGADRAPYKVPLSLALYEVTLPQATADKTPTENQVQSMREFISLMEQFYRAMLQMDAAHGEYFSFEIANPAGMAHTTAYIAVPSARKAMFEKQLLSLYPTARLSEQRDDYNAFADGAQTEAASAHLGERPIYSLRTFNDFPNDPLDSLLGAFSKLEETGEGAAVQFVISPHDRKLLPRYREAISQIQKGVPLSRATDVPNGLRRVWREVSDALAPQKKKQGEQFKQDDPRIKNIESKIASPLMFVDIRIVSSAKTAERAKAILQEIEAPFQQFADTAGNRLEFMSIPRRKLRSFARTFSYRLLDKRAAFPLSCTELATLAHLPRPQARGAAPELRQEKSAEAPAPVGITEQGALLGVNRFRGRNTPIHISAEDRLRHFYLIGQTGTGKSSLLKNMVAQDIRSGAGVCFIDPHGTDVLDILSVVPPERVEDVIYFDPSHIERPMGLNMLEYDPAHPEQKTLVVDELLGIFNKLFDMKTTGGPGFEQYFRNAALLVMDSPESGNTLLHIARVFSDESFRAMKIAHCKNPSVKEFWEGIAMKADGEQKLENWGPYITSKFDNFTSNEIMRPIISQQHSAFNFRDLMDNRKILLVNLAKGRIGELNANLLGLIIVGKFLIAALSRADSFGKDLPAFYLHIDEFQNFATPSIATILSEARKYKLSLTVAHQFIAQLTEEIRDAVFGNVGSLCAFRIGPNDAEYLEKQFTPIFSAQDLMHIDNYKAHLKLLMGGKPLQPFNIETLPFEQGALERVERMQQLSFLTYGRPREEIEATIIKNTTATPEQPRAIA